MHDGLSPITVQYSRICILSKVTGQVLGVDPEYLVCKLSSTVLHFNIPLTAFLLLVVDILTVCNVQQCYFQLVQCRCNLSVQLCCATCCSQLRDLCFEERYVTYRDFQYH